MVGEQERDKKGIYRTFQGTRYNLWTKRKLYVSQKNGKQTMLHRVFWESINGIIPKAHAVVPINDNWEDFNITQWECRPHTYNGKQFEPIAECVTFKGRRYFKAEGRPYFYHTFAIEDGKTRKTLLHRDIYKYIIGNIPKGHEIHHKDFDPCNNDSSNLVALSSEEHHKLHNEYKQRGSI